MIAVEPLSEMRGQLEAAPDAEVLAGSAEELPLTDASADAVVAASAFHWFDPDRGLPEIHRVLRPGGALATLGNGRDLSDPLQQQIQAIVAPTFRPPARCSAGSRVVDASPLFGPPEEFSTTPSSGSTPTGSRSGWARSRTSRGSPSDEQAEVLGANPGARRRAQPESPFQFRYRRSTYLSGRGGHSL